MLHQLFDIQPFSSTLVDFNQTHGFTDPHVMSTLSEGDMDFLDAAIKASEILPAINVDIESPEPNPITFDYLNECCEKIKEYNLYQKNTFSSNPDIEDLVVQLFMTRTSSFWDISHKHVNAIKKIHESLNFHDVQQQLCDIIAMESYANIIKWQLLGPAPHYLLSGYTEDKRPHRDDDGIMALFQPYTYLYNTHHNFDPKKLNLDCFLKFILPHGTAVNYELFAPSDHLYVQFTGRSLLLNEITTFKVGGLPLCPHCYELISNEDKRKTIQHLVECSLKAMGHHCGTCDETYTSYHNHILSVRHTKKCFKGVCFVNGQLGVYDRSHFYDLVSIHHGCVLPHLRIQFAYNSPLPMLDSNNLLLDLSSEPDFFIDYYKMLHALHISSDINEINSYPCLNCQDFTSSRWPFILNCIVDFKKSEDLCQNCGLHRATYFDRKENSYHQNNQLLDFFETYDDIKASVVSISSRNSVNTDNTKTYSSDFGHSIRIFDFPIYHSQPETHIRNDTTQQGSDLYLSLHLSDGTIVDDPLKLQYNFQSRYARYYQANYHEVKKTYYYEKKFNQNRIFSLALPHTMYKKKQKKKTSPDTKFIIESKIATSYKNMFKKLFKLNKTICFNYHCHPSFVLVDHCNKNFFNSF